MAHSDKPDRPSTMIEGRPKVGWSTHEREAARVLRRLVDLGGLSEKQAQRCADLLVSAVPDPERWLLFSVDLEAPKEASLKEISFWINELKSLSEDGEQLFQPTSAGTTSDQGPETGLQDWLLSLRAAVTEVWPEVALSQTLAGRREILEQVLSIHGSDQERVVRRDRFLAVISDVATEIGDRIRRPEECAEAIAAGLLDLSRSFVRDFFFESESERPRPGAEE